MPTFEPEGLQLGMILWCKLVVFQETVELLKVSPVEGDHCLCLEHGLVELQFITLGQGPQEASQSLDLATLLQHLAHASHLLLCEPETGHGLSAGRSVLCGRQHVSGTVADVQTKCIIRTAADAGSRATRCEYCRGTEGGQLGMGRSLSVWLVVVAKNHRRSRR